jgi:flagellar M-ring protein FliF
LRAEQGNWVGNQKDGAGAQPGGIPGALSNTPPPASTLTAPKPAPTPTPGATPAAPGAPSAAGAVVKRSVATAHGGIKTLTRAHNPRDIGPRNGKNQSSASGTAKRIHNHQSLPPARDATTVTGAGATGPSIVTRAA